MQFSWKENMFVVLICFLELLIQGALAADGCNVTIANFPAGVNLQLLFPRFIDREASLNFRGHRIKRNGIYFAFIEKETSYGQCIKDITDVVLKKFCLLKAEFLKFNNTYLMLRISRPTIYDSGCYTVHWEFGKVESKEPEGIYVDVNEGSGSPTTPSPTTANSTLNKDNVSHNPSYPSLSPAASSDASFTTIKQTLYLCCLLLAIVL